MFNQVGLGSDQF